MNDSENYLKLCKLLREFTILIHAIFKNNFKEIYKIEWKDNINYPKKFKYLLDNPQYNKSQQKKMKGGVLEEWDISIFFILYEKGIFYEEKLFKIIKQVKNIRNEIAHSVNLKFSTIKYEEYCLILYQPMIDLGFSAEKFTQIKKGTTIATDPLTSNEEYIKLKKIGNEYFNKKNYDKAIEFYSEGLKINLISSKGIIG